MNTEDKCLFVKPEALTFILNVSTVSVKLKVMKMITFQITNFFLPLI